jgi:glycosyltransferase involved in cell wall biosynthesis
MPVYNVDMYLAEAINSMLQQTVTDFELLIINDGSTDSTRDVVLKFTDPRIRFIENEHNIGLANTLNKGIDLARGEYIARMDGDDISLPHRLEKQAAILDQHPDIDVCGAGFRFFGAKNATVINPEQHEAIKAGLLFSCCVTIPLYRKKSLMEAHLQYEQEFFPAEDYRFWTECILKGLKIHNIQEILFLYRMHPTQVSEVMTNQSKMSDSVRTYYFQALFPSADLKDVKNFIKEFSGSTIIKTVQDLHWHKKFIHILDKQNLSCKNIDNNSLHNKLSSHVQYKFVSYVNSEWFINRYTPIKLIRLIMSGLYFELPKKFRLKLIPKAILLKRIQ